MDQTTFTENTIEQNIIHKVENKEKQSALALEGVKSLNSRNSPNMKTEYVPGVSLDGDLLEGSGIEYIPYNLQTDQIDATDKGENSCWKTIPLNLIHNDENLELNLKNVKNDSLPSAYVHQMVTPEIQEASSIGGKTNDKKCLASSFDLSQTDVDNGEIISNDDGAGKNDISTEIEIKETSSVVDSDIFDDMSDVATSRNELHMHCSTFENPVKHCTIDVLRDSIDDLKLNEASRQFQSNECNKKENNYEHLKEELVQEHVIKRDGGQNSAGKIEIVMKTNDVETSATKTIRVVLIGQTGAGKSSTGNTLLGANRFKNSFSSKSCTEVSQRESTVKRGLILEVIDTPGLFDTHKPPEELRKEFLNCMVMTNPGPHAFLLILKMNRITEQEKKTLHYLKKIFGGDQFLSHTIIVITRKEDFEETVLKSTEKTNEDIHVHELFQTTLENSPDLHHMVMQCKNRCFLLSNRGRVDGTKRTEQANQLMSLILEMTQSNENTFYSYQYFIDLEEERKQKLKREAEKKEEEERLKREMKQKDKLAKTREKELRLELERAQIEREREKERARREKEELEAKLRQEQLKRQREEQREQERYLAVLERERERKEREREKLREQARQARYIEQNQWRCVVM